ncbi:MAG: gliding motility protein GldM [Flavobacteriales bacterium]|nr:gliding motility protein GldM [Flavobacteriales bacterium]
MSGGDLPPRQKMIGMMYLVLTALLAMNVAKSILDAFVKINTGIQNTTVSFDASNSILYQAFDKARAESPAAAKWADKADQVKKMSNDMYNHIQSLKSKLIEITDKKTPEEADTINMIRVDAKDNYDEPTRIMGLAEPGHPTKVPGLEEFSGITLREKLTSFKSGLVSIFEDKDVEAEIGKKLAYLETKEMKNDDGNMDSWETGMFYHIPLAAVVTMLSKIQSDVRTAEAEVIAKLYERIDAGGVSFNAVQGMAVLPKAYIMSGDTFRASVFTAAYDDRVTPEIYITKTPYDTAAALEVEKTGKFDINAIMKGQKGTSWKDGDWYQMDEKDIAAGKGNLKVVEGVGVHDWGGIIKLNTKKGPKVYPFKSSFEVGKPSLAISADKMNVFYMGVDNPVSISAPMPKFTASAPGLTKSGQGWVMRPKSPGNVTISVTGEDETTGKKVPLGKAEFRVKRIPTPVAYIAGKTGTVVLSKSELGDGVIKAELEGFVFDLQVKCKSFEIGTTVNGDYKSVKCTGNRMNDKAKAMVKSGARNQRFYLEKMAVTMPDGRTVEMGNMTVKLK